MHFYMPPPFGPYMPLLKYPGPRTYADSYSSEFEHVVRQLASLEQERDGVKKQFDEYRKKLRELDMQIQEVEHRKFILSTAHQIGPDFY
jgi:septal ring factor EnvC (AmiA/AmiB activator)